MAFADRLAFARKQKKINQALDPENRSHMFATIDVFIKAAKLKSIAAS